MGKGDLIWQRVKGEGRRFYRAILAFNRDYCLIWASTLALITLFAIVPLFVLAFPLVTSFRIFSDLQTKITNWIAANFIPSTGTVIIEYLHQFIKKSSSLSLTGLISFIFISISLMITIEHALNTVWKTKENRPPAEKFTLYWSAITLTPLLIGISLYLSTLISNKGDSTLFSSLLNLFRHASPIIFSFAAFFLIIKLFPNTKVRVVPALIGSLLAAIFFEIGKWGFGIFVRYFASYPKIYGPLSTILLFFLWVYVIWVIVLFCSELVYDIQREFYPETAPSGSTPQFREFYTLNIFETLAQAFQRGEPPLSIKELKKRTKAPLEVIGEVITQFRRRGIVAEAAPGGRYLIASDPTNLSAADILLATPGGLFSSPEEERETNFTKEALDTARKHLKETLSNIRIRKEKVLPDEAVNSNTRIQRKKHNKRDN